MNEEERVELVACPFCGAAMQKTDGPGGLPSGFFHPCPPPTKLNPPCLLRNSVFSDCDLAAWNTRASLQGANTVSEAVTDEMVEAGKLAGNQTFGPFEGPNAKAQCDAAYLGAIYTAMRAAAPTAPVQDDDAEWLGRVQSSIEELAYIAGHENTTLAVAQAALRAKEVIERIATRLSADHTGVLVERERDLEAHIDLLTEAAEAAIYALRQNGYPETSIILEKALMGLKPDDAVIGVGEATPDHG